MTGLKPILAAAALLTGSAVWADDKAALAAEGKALIQSFASQLQGELKAAMKAGGPVEAIGVCNASAPVIAETLSEESGWSVARSSHKLRNPGNEPDAYTAAVIDEFLKREADGAKAKDLVKTEIVTENGEKVFRMVKAIPTGEVCLTCHGANVKPDVEATLAEYYPDDQARGFAPGQMRGVFTLTKPLH
ncbi:MAG: Tll0287-like domain-containing protein [Marinibacterium sp.]